MIGDMISKVRKSRNMTKTELARLTDINIGHLTHIEKSERNPSHKALKNICRALDIPYQQLMYTYGKTLSEDQVAYGFIEHITHNRVPAISINDFIECPPNMPGSSLAIKVADDSMSPLYEKGDYVFVELNSLLNDKECGVFKLNNKILMRNFSNKKDVIVLKAKNKETPDITVKKDDNFYIIGKVLGK
ncbi:MAG: XRE family transcriptional regulator [Oscillospiraceae bacterium]|nr:XRE family transcriptional regulator [Oscillospiraceae bacterium]